MSIQRSAVGMSARRARLGALAVVAFVSATLEPAVANASLASERSASSGRADRCDCLTLWVPAPRELSESQALDVELRGQDNSAVVQFSVREEGGGNRFVLLTTRMPVVGVPSLAGIGEVVFLAPDGSEFSVPIVLRISRPGDSAASGFNESCELTERLFEQVRAFAAGLEGALGQSSLRGEAAGFDQGRAAAAAAVFVETASGPWAVRGGVGIFQRGGKSDLGSSKVVIGVNYLDIPMTAQYRFAPFRNITPFVFGGASAGIRLTCEISITGSLLTDDEPCSGTLGGGNPRLLDALVHLGGGAAMPIGDAVLEVGLRSTLGAVVIGSPVDARNSGWSLVASTRIPLGSSNAGPRTWVRPLATRARSASRCEADA